MFFIIGVDHIIQHGGYLDDKKRAALAAFEAYLTSTASKYDIDIIAEEFSEILLSRNNTEFCTCREVAQLLNLEHRFCDPDPKERQHLSIETDEQREQEWLNRLEDARRRTVLFICGSSHIETFADLLRRHAIDSRVLSDKWGYEYLGKGPVQYYESTFDSNES